MTGVEGIANNFYQYLPNLLIALVLIIIAWIVAILVKNLIEKLLFKFNVDEKLGKGRPKEGEYGKESVYSIAKIAYFLVFILFLPSILDQLQMGSVASPITNMMETLLGFIPRLIGAGLILFVGYFVAKLIRDLVARLLQTVNLDKWYDKLNPSQRKVGVTSEQQNDAEVAGKPVDKNALSNVLSKIVFGIILIPVITMALETLAISSLTEPLVEILNSVMAMIPNIFVAILLIVLGYYISRFISQILEQLLRGVGIDRIYSWMDDTTNNDVPRFDLGKIIGNVVQVLIMIFITVEALNILNLDVLNGIGIAVIAYIPLILSGLIIIGLGVIGGYLIEGLIKKYANSPFTAAIAKYIIIIFAVFMTLEQIRFASTIVSYAFLLVLGGLSVAFALSFGLGGREFAKRQLEKFEEKAEKENKKSEVNDPMNKNPMDDNSMDN